MMSDLELIRTLFNQKCDLSETLARMKYGDDLIECARAHFMSCSARIHRPGSTSLRANNI